MPSWTRDGKEILFYPDRGGNWDVYVMKADGSSLQNLTRHPSRDMNPSAGPEGRITFVSAVMGTATSTSWMGMERDPIP